MDSKVVRELPGDGPTLDVDPVLIRHALFNLLTNAAQANPAGGTITVTPVSRNAPAGTNTWMVSLGS